jgi:murein DD-endopeptidase MepM/ murein hydrolase activator NlpD
MKFAAMKTAGGAAILGRSFCSARILIPVVILALAGVGASFAQTMYKYRGADGEWIYTDRKPLAEEQAEVRQLVSTFVQPEFSVTHSVLGKTIEIIAHNEFYAPVEVSLEFLEIRGVEYPHPDEVLRWVVDPRSDQLLLNLDFLDEGSAPFVDFLFQYMPGDPTARHNPADGYRAPFSAGMNFPITQAYPDAVTHRSIDSIFAVDIAMPVGTDVVAARNGVVVDVSADNFRNGLDMAVDGPAANIVRILHDDGTFGLYAHLNWNSIRVKPGDQVRAGQYIADSGNTGFSSGPHLHFSIQRNAGLKVESLPVVFKGPDMNTIVPASGDVLTAYQ